VRPEYLGACYITWAFLLPWRGPAFACALAAFLVLGALGGGGLVSCLANPASERICWGYHVLGLEPACSDRLWDFFHSSALDLN
jgi:hypothetical protein